MKLLKLTGDEGATVYVNFDHVFAMEVVTYEVEAAVSDAPAKDAKKTPAKGTAPVEKTEKAEEAKPVEASASTEDYTVLRLAIPTANEEAHQLVKEKPEQIIDMLNAMASARKEMWTS